MSFSSYSLMEFKLNVCNQLSVPHSKTVSILHIWKYAMDFKKYFNGKYLFECILNLPVCLSNICIFPPLQVLTSQWKIALRVYYASVCVFVHEFFFFLAHTSCCFSSENSFVCAFCICLCMSFLCACKFLFVNEKCTYAFCICVFVQCTRFL